jgi:hypothetical protein
MRLLTTTFIFFILCSCNENKKSLKSEVPVSKIEKGVISSEESISQRDYPMILKSILEKFEKEKTISDENLIQLIPLSQEEFKQYYSLSYPEKGKRWNSIYNEIELIIGKRATINQQVFKKYLGLAPFVDGEYAEGYFEDADFIIGKHQKFFCEIFDSLPVKTKKTLSDLHLQYCK